MEPSDFTFSQQPASLVTKFPLLSAFFKQLHEDYPHLWEETRQYVASWNDRLWQVSEERLNEICELAHKSSKYLASIYGKSVAADLYDWQHFSSSLTLLDMVELVYEKADYPILEALDFVFDASAHKRLEFNQQQVMNIDEPIFSLCEIGIGSAEILINAIKTLNPSRVVAVDIARSPIDFASRRLTRRNIPMIGFLQASVDKLPIETSSFDLVLANEVIEHVKNPQFALQEISRIVSNGGSVIISTSIGFPSQIHLGEFPTTSEFLEQLKACNLEVIVEQQEVSSFAGIKFLDVFVMCRKTHLVDDVSRTNQST